MTLCLDCNGDLPPDSIASRLLCDPCSRHRKNMRKAQRDKERRAAMGMSERQFRKTKPRLGAPSKGKWCRQCEGMPHRRPLLGDCACGERWAPEVIVMAPPAGGQWWWCR